MACPTGKVPYSDKAAAEHALKHHHRKNDRTGPWRMSAYPCREDDCSSWHLGHLAKRPPSVRVRATGRRADDLRAYLAAVRVQAATRQGLPDGVLVAALRAQVELARLDRQAMERNVRDGG